MQQHLEKQTAASAAICVELHKRLLVGSVCFVLCQLQLFHPRCGVVLKVTSRTLLGFANPTRWACCAMVDCSAVTAAQHMCVHLAMYGCLVVSLQFTSLLRPCYASGTGSSFGVLLYSSLKTSCLLGDSGTALPWAWMVQVQLSSVEC